MWIAYCFIGFCFVMILASIYLDKRIDITREEDWL